MAWENNNGHRRTPTNACKAVKTNVSNEIKNIYSQIEVKLNDRTTTGFSVDSGNYR